MKTTKIFAIVQNPKPIKIKDSNTDQTYSKQKLTNISGPKPKLF